MMKRVGAKSYGAMKVVKGTGRGGSTARADGDNSYGRTYISISLAIPQSQETVNVFVEEWTGATPSDVLPK